LGCHSTDVNGDASGPLRDVDLAGIDWVIVGGESVYRLRPEG
jgi:protein gp37